VESLDIRSLVEWVRRSEPKVEDGFVVSNGTMGCVAGLLDTDTNKQIGGVGACELGWLLMEDRDTHWYSLDNFVRVGMDGGEEEEDGDRGGE